mmetsp:Transcript_14513/g.22704  ORF Transcript_14513/g.22704 Transcript_14513/m.22704 type:complete len:101 (-) Transcript_14513:1062-1364(-)
MASCCYNQTYITMSSPPSNDHFTTPPTAAVAADSRKSPITPLSLPVQKSPDLPLKNDVQKALQWLCAVLAKESFKFQTFTGAKHFKKMEICIHGYGELCG